MTAFGALSVAFALAALFSLAAAFGAFDYRHPYLTDDEMKDL